MRCVLRVFWEKVIKALNCILCCLWGNYLGSWGRHQNGNIFCAAGPLCGEFTGDRWIPCVSVLVWFGDHLMRLSLKTPLNISMLVPALPIYGKSEGICTQIDHALLHFLLVWYKSILPISLWLLALGNLMAATVSVKEHIINIWYASTSK